MITQDSTIKHINSFYDKFNNLETKVDRIVNKNSLTREEYLNYKEYMEFVEVNKKINAVMVNDVKSLLEK